MEDIRKRLSNAQRRGTHGSAAKDMLLLLALVCLGASGVYWWGVQSTLLPNNHLIAGAFTAILVVAPPTLTSFLIPWSPGGMLLQRVNAKTWGQVAVVMASIYLVYYSFQIQYNWWAAQQVVANSGLVYQQVLIGLIGFIIIPALLWTPVSSDELVEKLKQAHLVKQYELQTQADIAVLQATLLRAQQLAARGFANLVAAEKQELAAVMRGITGGIDRTIQEMAGNLNNTSRTVFDGKAGNVFGAPAFSDDLVDIIEYVAGELSGSVPADSPARVALPAAQPAIAAADQAGSAQPASAAPTQGAIAAADQARSGSAISDHVISADLRSAEIPDHERYQVALGRLGYDGWTDEQLAKALGVAYNTARQRRNAWRQAGLVQSAASEGTWKFTEREVRP